MKLINSYGQEFILNDEHSEHDAYGNKSYHSIVTFADNQGNGFGSGTFITSGKGDIYGNGNGSGHGNSYGTINGKSN